MAAIFYLAVIFLIVLVTQGARCFGALLTDKVCSHVTPV